MALVVEDGTGKSNANSYADLATIRAYTLARGVDLSATADADLEVMVIKAMDYLQAQEGRYQGYRVQETQALSFPRYDVYVDGFSIDSNEIPSRLVNALGALVLEVNAGNDLQPSFNPTDATGGIIEEKVGDLAVKYDSPVRRSWTPAFARAEALLSGLYKQNGLELVRA